MRQIDPSVGHDTVLSHLRVLAKRLKSRPDTLHLVPDVDAARVELARRIEDWQDADDESVAATGSVHYADDVEDAAVANVARRAKAEFDGLLNSPQYVRLFPSSASELTRGMADETQALFVGHLITTILENDDYVSLRKAARQLAEAHADLVAAKQDRARREQEEVAAWTELQIATDAARAVYRDTRPKLELVFPGRRRLVDSFFPRSVTKRKKEPKVAAAAPSAAPVPSAPAASAAVPVAPASATPASDAPLTSPVVAEPTAK